MPNVTLLKSTFAHVVQHPERWDQGDWRACMAAHVVMASGGRWVTTDATEETSLAVLATADEREMCQGRAMRLPAGTVVEGVWVWERAVRLLDITPRQGRQLFAPTNTLDDLRQIIHDLCEAA
ncbi:hypothetical protein AB0I81_22425 [Nonomuraea sp. NPDC050404]|uniref:hypothetical protein n=1 Tax=Nonomuraea sp. NPDC050404 TaxID=3155783 RepID=UPI0033E6DB73